MLIRIFETPASRQKLSKIAIFFNLKYKDFRIVRVIIRRGLRVSSGATQEKDNVVDRKTIAKAGEVQCYWQVVAMGRDGSDFMSYDSVIPGTITQQVEWSTSPMKSMPFFITDGEGDFGREVLVTDNLFPPYLLIREQ
ncbi:hypothetical protein LTR09_005444 [Extremus antarcticus]|uniref:Uncharacterized protein n=1 Tax=Extremus antarcticus TaxID=702011 RepID=A0AAJ0DNB6_9PEZI|nr:hypothetical protein LTR09_005444 [Extremus antarcticus]